MAKKNEDELRRNWLNGCTLERHMEEEQPELKIWLFIICKQGEETENPTFHSKSDQNPTILAEKVGYPTLVV